MPLVLALSGGAAIFAVIIVLFVLGLAYTAYSKAGSGIDAHPIDSQSAPGAGRDAGLQNPDREDVREAFDERGAR